MNKKIVRMQAGLANRMFHYSLYLYMKKLGYDVYVDNSFKTTKWKIDEVYWEEIFPNAILRKAPKSLVLRYGCGYDLLSYVRRHYMKWSCPSLHMGNPYRVPTKEEMDKYHAFIGLYANVDMINQVENEVKRCFAFPKFEDKKNQDLADKMRNEESIGIHLRKGKDYLTLENFLNTCPIEYYQNAVKIIKEKINNPHFYVFTDNPEWVQENLRGINYQLIDWNTPIGKGNHCDMQLMTCCKHNIISNSTYSWWAAYLNDNPDKIVIEPSIWYNPETRSEMNEGNKLLCPNWVII